MKKLYLENEISQAQAGLQRIIRLIEVSANSTSRIEEAFIRESMLYELPNYLQERIQAYSILKRCHDLLLPTISRSTKQAMNTFVDLEYGLSRACIRRRSFKEACSTLLLIDLMLDNSSAVENISLPDWVQGERLSYYLDRIDLKQGFKDWANNEEESWNREKQGFSPSSCLSFLTHPLFPDGFPVFISSQYVALKEEPQDEFLLGIKKKAFDLMSSMGFKGEVRQDIGFHNLPIDEQKHLELPIFMLSLCFLSRQLEGDFHISIAQDTLIAGNLSDTEEDEEASLKRIIHNTNELGLDYATIPGRFVLPSRLVNKPDIIKIDCNDIEIVNRHPLSSTEGRIEKKPHRDNMFLKVTALSFILGILLIMCFRQLYTPQVLYGGFRIMDKDFCIISDRGRVLQHIDLKKGITEDRVITLGNGDYILVYTDKEKVELKVIMNGRLRDFNTFILPKGSEYLYGRSNRDKSITIAFYIPPQRQSETGKTIIKTLSLIDARLIMERIITGYKKDMPSP